MQLDYERQITDLISQEISKLDDKQARLREEFEIALSKAAGNNRQAQKDYELKFSEYREQLDGQGTLLRDSIFQLEDYAIRLSQDSEKIRDLEKRIDSQFSLITKYGEQLEAVKKELNGILGEME